MSGYNLSSTSLPSGAKNYLMANPDCVTILKVMTEKPHQFLNSENLSRRSGLNRYYIAWNIIRQFRRYNLIQRKVRKENNIRVSYWRPHPELVCPLISFLEGR